MATEYGYTKNYLTRDGKPWFPIMGEFHYSRYPQQYWKESLYKMKAGGVDIVSSYVFWLHHDEEEGVYDFSGQRNLHKFVEMIQECGLKMFLRIGPWCHGEARNGGFPDWLLRKEFEPRTNDEAYFETVRKFYTEIFKQVKGFFHQEGGPIIGIQIENEYGHCGGLNGDAGEYHMKRLTEMAKEIGMITPLYTATGWGGAVTGGLLPVMGGYCEAPWDQRVTELEPNENYIFTNDRNDPNIGSDYGKTHNITYDITAFPYLTAELGGGLQVTHHRRPVAHAKDIGAMSLAKLGSGVSLLGYYMYHGGTNPEGKLSTLQESRATGYLNDLPELSYDFSAPVREYGQMSGTLNEIKILAMFAKDFGSDLCKMDTVWENENAQMPEDFKTLRAAVRKNRDSGYLFVNNYQRRHVMAEHLQEVLRVELGQNECIEYPPVDICDGDYFFLPFHMPVGDGVLESAVATPLCCLQAGSSRTNHAADNAVDSNINNDMEKAVYVFYTDCEPAYHWITEPTNAKVLTISREMALNSWKVKLDREYLLITEDKVIEASSGISDSEGKERKRIEDARKESEVCDLDKRYELLIRKGSDLRSCPALPTAPEGYRYTGMDGEFALYKKAEALPTVNAACNLLREEAGKKYYEIELNYPAHINDCFLQIDFAGDQARLYIDGKCSADWFYTGVTWEIGMKRFGFPKKVTVEVDVLYETDEIFLETRPEFVNGIACEIKSVNAGAEVVAVI